MVIDEGNFVEVVVLLGDVMFMDLVEDYFLFVEGEVGMLMSIWV